MGLYNESLSLLKTLLLVILLEDSSIRGTKCFSGPALFYQGADQQHTYQQWPYQDSDQSCIYTEILIVVNVVEVTLEL